MSNTVPGVLTRWSCFRNRLTMSRPFRLFQMQRAERPAPDNSPCPAGKGRSVYKASMSIRTLKMQVATNPHFQPARLLVQRIPVSRPALLPSIHSGAPLLSGLPCRSVRLFGEAGTLFRPDLPASRYPVCHSFPKRKLPGASRQPHDSCLSIRISAELRKRSALPFPVPRQAPACYPPYPEKTFHHKKPATAKTRFPAICPI